MPEVEHKSINNHHKLTKSIPSKMSFHYPPIELNLKVKCLTVALGRYKLVLSLLLTMMNSVYSYSMSILFRIPIYQIKRREQVRLSSENISRYMGEENMLRQLYWCSVTQQLFLNPIYTFLAIYESILLGHCRYKYTTELAAIGSPLPVTWA